MTTQNQQKQDQSAAQPLWEFVPLQDYAGPADQASKAAAKVWLSILQKPRHEDATAGPGDAQHDLHPLSRERLAQLVPPLPWADAAAALDAALQDWTPPGRFEQGVKFLIGQPFSGHAEIAAMLGARHQAVEIPPPSVEQILSNDERWFDNWPPPGTLWVLPKLEHCYLRHAKGLDLLRRLLSLAANGQLGKGLAGCDSWAWAYVLRIFPLPQVDAITLQAFDADRLQRLFRDLTNARSEVAVHYYNAKTGKEILNAAPNEESPQKEFRELATYCRGNVAVAATCWRERLRHKNNQEQMSDEEAAATPTDDTRPDEVLWVAEMPSEPELPPGPNDEAYLLLLHAMLLQGGLPESLLDDLLPFSAARCRGLLGQLQQSGMAHPVDGRWQVRELAYLAVRRLLNAHDYLTDSF